MSIGAPPSESGADQLTRTPLTLGDATGCRGGPGAPGATVHVLEEPELPLLALLPLSSLEPLDPDPQQPLDEPELPELPDAPEPQVPMTRSDTTLDNPSPLAIGGTTSTKSTKEATTITPTWMFRFIPTLPSRVGYALDHITTIRSVGL